MSNLTLDQCISWVKIKMVSKNDEYSIIYEWNMLLTILQYLERYKALEKSCNTCAMMNYKQSKN